MNMQKTSWAGKHARRAMPVALQPPFSRSLNIGLVAGPDFSLISLAAVCDIFSAVNQLEQADRIRLHRVSITGAPVPAAGGLLFAPDTGISCLYDRMARARGLDAVFICCGEAGISTFERPLLNLFRSCRRNNVPLYSIGEEMRLLVKAGLAGRATPHWSRLAYLREQHPEAELSENLYHLERQISTCSGHAATLDFAVKFLAETLGADVAGAVCRQLLIGFPRDSSQSQVKVDYHRIRNAPPHLKLAVDAMYDNIEEPLALQEIARASGVSLRQIERLFAAHLSASPGRYYRGIRLEVAKQMIEQTDLTLFEISAATGFGSANNLTKVFKVQFGKLPREFRKLAKCS
ncbi:GlxA family transcriptional regulator [Leisingera sp. F5]|uniref:GlxA family transcriptional regulator n=1 Tax=Leisingera sp. F5 TaxID=1813816 RepID=UPI000A67A49E|nr:helix-turn-helix domain-containing protein [Leisingera sp. F5]